MLWRSKTIPSAFKILMQSFQRRPDNTAGIVLIRLRPPINSLAHSALRGDVMRTLGVPLFAGPRLPQRIVNLMLHAIPIVGDRIEPHHVADSLPSPFVRVVDQHRLLMMRRVVLQQTAFVDRVVRSIHRLVLLLWLSREQRLHFGLGYAAVDNL